MQTIPVRQIVSSDASDTSSGSFSIRELQALLTGEDMVQSLHRHDFFYLLVLQKGAGKHIIDFVPYPVTDGAVFLMRPGQVHELMLGGASEGYLLQFNADFYYMQEGMEGDLLQKAGSQSYYQLDVLKFGSLGTILDQVLEEFTNKEELYQAAIRSLLQVFLIGLVRQMDGATADKSSTYAQEKMNRLSWLLDKHLTEHKSVAAYAALLNLSVYQLNAIVKSAVGKNCSVLINERLMLEAKRQLLATGNQVKEIAYLLGYEDISYFIRFFKKHTGYSPEQFREQYSR